MGKKVCLLVVDPQVDFCDPGEELKLETKHPVYGDKFVRPVGKLYVKGADEDMKRLAAMVRRVKGDLEEVVVTLDSHRTLHVAHPIFWRDKDGNHPAPFTLINVDDVTGANPKWRATNQGYQQRCVEYVQKLKANGRYVLCIWPPHCLIGSAGYQVMPVLFDALCEWEQEFAAVNYVTKGSNIFTEHYSAVQADVYDPEDPGTGLNTNLIKLLQEMDMIAIGGEASSHCIRATVMDIANNFGDDNIKKLVYLEDACSPVPGFEDKEKEFMKEMIDRGMKVTTTDKFLR